MSNHDSNLYDICIIGGGINGTGIARDCAGRGYKTILIEQRDLASATSSKSTKLIHGGLRYLEQYEFRLVRESLQERNKLIKIAPHIIWPLNFILPHEPYIRPYYLIRLGLYLYDLLGFTFTKTPFDRSWGLDLKIAPWGNGLKNKNRKALGYSDAWVDDARLVTLNARDAFEKGATISTYTEVISIKPKEDQWIVTTDKGDIQTRLIVNAAGPWVRALLYKNQLTSIGTPRVRHIKGSHIITKSLYKGHHAYILQQPDKRIVFAIPYESDFTLIGTTEELYEGNPYDAAISNEERDYLINIINENFEAAINEKDILHTYSGVRALYDNAADDARTLTRDYKIIFDTYESAPILSIFGGKITTYRALAEHVSDEIDNFFGKEINHWTDSKPLSGGEINPIELFRQLQIQYPDLNAKMLKRLVYSYGGDSAIILSQTPHIFIASSVLKAEIDFGIKHEFIKATEDFLKRRTKLYLHLNEDEQNNIKNYINEAVLNG